MKKRLVSWKEVLKIASEKDGRKHILVVYGLDENDVDWGCEVEIFPSKYEDCYGVESKHYEFNENKCCFSIPKFLFK